MRHQPRCPHCHVELPENNPKAIKNVLFCPDCHHHIPMHLLESFADHIILNREHEAVEEFGDFLMYAPETKTIGEKTFPILDHLLI